MKNIISVRLLTLAKCVVSRPRLTLTLGVRPGGLTPPKTLVALLALVSIWSSAQTQKASDSSPERRLYTIATAHLDTQWRWTIQTTINEYIPATFRNNFKLFEAYPDYTFSFEGAWRYMLLKEYYPEEYLKLKKYVADGRWRLAGSWVDAVDVNIPSSESLIRQTLYGNGYFKREFGKTSCDVFLPDCFGFGYALPAVAAHCGLKGFSTQKLAWGSAFGVPFDIGRWEGVDGSTLVAELRPGDYTSQVSNDLSRDSTWQKTIDHQGEISGLYAGFKYFGTGDIGGAPDSASVAWVQKSVHSDGPIKVLSTGSDELARTLSAEQKAELPLYQGELIMTRHGVGCYSSQAAMKRWNRKNELLADAAERASVIADWLGGIKYPLKQLRQTWIYFLWHQFHDDITGTSIPEAYQFSWNDEILCQNRFASFLTDAATATAAALDTKTKGIPILVFNPLSIDRQDVVEAEIAFEGKTPISVRVFDLEGKEVPSQIAEQRDKTIKVLFLAEVPSVGYAVYDVRSSKQPCTMETQLKATPTSLENQRYRLQVDAQGNVASIYDKVLQCELLSNPIKLQLLNDNPNRWPAWEIDSTDIKAAPRETVGGEAQICVVENGPVRVGLQITRRAGNSLFSQTIRLAAGGAENRVEFDNEIDWKDKATLLKAAFPLTSSNDSVTYDLSLGSIKRGLNKPELYEVPGQQWADLRAENGDYGVAILNDCKYGWDHPDKNTLRLTLIHTPGVKENWSWVGDQSTQDLGRHLVKYALQGHRGDWREGQVCWEAARLNQPLLAFQTTKHAGKLGRSFSLLRVETSDGRAVPSVAVKAVKAAEESKEIVIRLQELTGRPVDGVRVKFERPIATAREINGAEDEIGAARIEAGALCANFKAYQPRSFALRLEKPAISLTPERSVPLTLPYNLDGISSDEDRKDGNFDGKGNTLAGELLPDSLNFGGATFSFGPKAAQQQNVVTCQGQQIQIPDGKYQYLNILACAVGGAPAWVSFQIDDHKNDFWIPDYASFLGQWNSRIIGGEFTEDPLKIAPAYINQTPVAWTGTHQHNSAGENVAYRYTNLYLIKLDLPKGSKTITLPNNPEVRVLAASLVQTDFAPLAPAQPLYDKTAATLTEIEIERRNFIDHTFVRLSSPIPGADIHYTLEGSDPTPKSQHYFGPFELRATTTIKARAFCSGFDDAYIAETKVIRQIPRPPVAVADLKPGLTCRYYEGAWKEVPDVDKLTPLREVVVGSISIPDFARKESFALQFVGYIQIPQESMYTFYTTSDDGSRLYIGDTLVVNNDGLHGAGKVAGEIALQAGWHTISVLMFQGEGDKWLEVAIAGPDLKKQPLAWTWLKHVEK